MIEGNAQFEFGSHWAWLLAAGLVLFVSAAWHRRPRPGRHRKDASRLVPTVAVVVQVCTFAAAMILLALSLSGEDAGNDLMAPAMVLLVASVLHAATVVALRPGAEPVLRLPALSLPLEQLGLKPTRLHHLPPVLRFLVLGALVVVMARPQIATTESDVYTEGMDIVITLDLSTSMNAVDFAPPGRARRLSRIEGARQVIADFIRQRRHDRLALVVFAAEAFTQCPLTLDYSVLANVVKVVRTGVIKDGTAIGDALMISINRLEGSEAKSKVIVLLTDGDDNASHVAPVQAAELAARKGIHVFPIMVGKGGKVPFPVGKNVFGQTHYQYVEIKTNPELLKHIAKATKGKFYRAVDKQALAEDFQDILDHMEKTRLMDPGRYTRRAEMFQVVLLGAVLLLLFEQLLSWSRLRRFP